VRLTINLDDDLYAMARSHAIATKTSLSKAVGDLLRRRQAVPPAPKSADADIYLDPILGIQVSRAARPITMEEIHRAMDDEDVRNLEMMGLSPAEIERGLNS
jgi:hypothetical protein